TRDDYFYDHCDEPTVEIHGEEVEGSGSNTGLKFLKINLKWGESKTVNFNFIDQYDGDIIEYEIKPWGGSPDSEYTDNEMKTFNNKYFEVTLDKTLKTLTLTDKTKSALDHLVGDNSICDYDLVFQAYLKLRNKLGKEGRVNVLITFTGNNCPKPKIGIKDTENNMEKFIYIDPQCDPDGDEVVKYEYCIDGNVKFIYDEGGYEIQGFYSEPEIQSGESAWNGTYITATSLNEIRHAFQQKGNHNIYVRCQDKWGKWSGWINQKININ
ncbi:MAG TPA: hypothetical protein PKW49_11060, partial [Paludibacteraceae bacterium]|nr:hypothetical protein [Paludibacteraceae bacterium]